MKKKYISTNLSIFSTTVNNNYKKIVDWTDPHEIMNLLNTMRLWNRIACMCPKWQKYLSIFFRLRVWFPCFCTFFFYDWFWFRFSLISFLFLWTILVNNFFVCPSFKQIISNEHVIHCFKSLLENHRHIATKLFFYSKTELANFKQMKYFHKNNKFPVEMELAIKWKVISDGNSKKEKIAFDFWSHRRFI